MTEEQMFMTSQENEGTRHVQITEAPGDWDDKNPEQLPSGAGKEKPPATECPEDEEWPRQRPRVLNTMV